MVSQSKRACNVLLESFALLPELGLDSIFVLCGEDYRHHGTRRLGMRRDVALLALNNRHWTPAQTTAIGCPQSYHEPGFFLVE